MSCSLKSQNKRKSMGYERSCSFFLLFFNVGIDRLIFDSCKCPKNGLVNNLGSPARDRHSDLLSDRFLTAFKNEIITEGLKSGSFSVCQCARITPVINMSTAASASCNRVCWFVRVKTLIYLADFRTFDI